MKINFRILILTAFLLCGLLLPSAALEAVDVEDLPDQPAAGTWIYDYAGILEDASVVRLNRLLAQFEANQNITLLAVTVPSLSGQSMDHFSSRLFDRWRIGEDHFGGGLLWLLAVQERQVRFEVGYELEDVFADAFVGYLERDQMLPFFAQGRIADGFEATVELIVERGVQELDRIAMMPFNQIRPDEKLSGGAGATVSTQSEKTVPLPPAKPDMGVINFYTAQPNPERTFALYLDRARKHVRDPQLGIFTPESRALLEDWVVTPAQMDHEYETYRDEPYNVLREGDHAVIRFQTANKKLSPFFLKKTDEGWQIDLVTMSNVIRFNQRNEWRFATDNHPYRFAFTETPREI